MSSDDIRDLRRRHRHAVARSLHAGYDVVYVYAAHGLTTLQHFLSRRYNDRDGRVRRQPREPRPPPARGARGDARGVRGPRRRRLPDRGRRAARRRTASAAPRSRSCSASSASMPDLWDFMVGFWQDDSITVPLRPRGLDGGALPRAEAADLEAGRRRRLAHLARHDGPARQRRRARPDRRGAAVDRRSVPAEEDRGGPARGHPRMHRLQRLRHRRLDGDADPLHPEPVDGRGVAPRLASRSASGRSGLRRRRCSSSAAGRRGSRRRRCSASAATRSCSPRRRASSAGGLRPRRGCPGSRPGSGSSTTAASSSRSSRT